MEVACRSWQWWARERVQVNTYLTTQDTSGFTLHWDDHDVIIVQLAGEKSWDVRTPSRPVPIYRDAAPNSEPSNEHVWSGTLTAGDVMHIPRGYWHQASRTNQGCRIQPARHVRNRAAHRRGLANMAGGPLPGERVFRHDLIRLPPGRATADAMATVPGIELAVCDCTLRDVPVTPRWQ